MRENLSSEDEPNGTDYSERRERAFKRDFALAMWRDLPDEAKERLRGEECQN